ncbi:MAG TPA: DUF6111 family protein [Stellaceae bacterium]|nr:DUF6111 family protein [Stellaceae bacterium]
MTRVALTILLPLLAPTAIYFLWLHTVGRADERGTPWTWLIVGGLAAAALALVIIGVGTGGPRPGRYVPPHLEGGRLVPGQIVPPESR